MSKIIRRSKSKIAATIVNICTPSGYTPPKNSSFWTKTMLAVVKTSKSALIIQEHAKLYSARRSIPKKKLLKLTKKMNQMVK